MYTYQDFAEDCKKGKELAVEKAINNHVASPAYKMAKLADAYNRQQNDTIMKFVKWLYGMDGEKVQDTFSSNHKLCCNYFHNLNKQRVTYSLGNGIALKDAAEKEALGKEFDTKLSYAAFDALIHGEAFLFYNNGETTEFQLTEFVPLLDEETGVLRAGVRFWQVDAEKPLIAVLYEEDGYTRYRKDKSAKMQMKEDKRAYLLSITTTEADEAAGNPPDISGDNYGGRLPIVPLWGTRLKQSTLVGMQSKLDAYDLIQSGFANDLSDCSEIYWLVSGAGGMNDNDLARFRDRLKLNHIGSVPNADDVQVNGFTQEIPYAARKELLENLRSSIYEDYGGLDVHTISAGSTNDHIDAAYQPLDDNADDFEYQIITAVQALFEIAGVPGEHVAKFKRNRISNQKEAAEMVMLFAPYLSEDTIRAKAPFLSADEIEEENQRAAAEDIRRITMTKDRDV